MQQQQQIGVPNQDTQNNNIEQIFVSGIDSTVTESEISELFKFTTGGDIVVNFQKFMLKEQEKVLTKIQLSKESAVMAHSKLNGQKIKDCVMKLIPANCMKSIVLMGLPLVFSEKDLFLLLNSKCKGLKNIIVADDPQNVGKTQGLVVAIYKTHEEASIALQTLHKSTIMQKEVECYWKEPEEDIIKQMSLESRCIYINNISYSCSEDNIIAVLKEFGNIVRIKHFINKAYVEFDSVESAKKAFQSLNKKRIDGKVWEIYPARKENTQLVRDGIEKNIVYSIEFMGNQQDKQSLIRNLITGQMPACNPVVQQKANQILQHVKQMQQNQLNMLKTQVENQKNLNQQNFSNFGQQQNNNNNAGNNKKNKNNNMDQNMGINNNSNNNMQMNNNNMGMNNMGMNNNMGNNNMGVNNTNMGMNNNNMGMNNNNINNMGGNNNSMNNNMDGNNNMGANNNSMNNNQFNNNENSNQNMNNNMQQQQTFGVVNNQGMNNQINNDQMVNNMSNNNMQNNGSANQVQNINFNNNSNNNQGMMNNNSMGNTNNSGNNQLITE